MRQDNPTTTNPTRPQHPLALALDSDYTYKFALLSRNPHSGRLPRELLIDLRWLSLLRNQIADGPTANPKWRRPASHVSEHDSELRELQQIHLQLLDKSKRAISALGSKGSSPQLQESGRLIVERMDKVKSDDKYSYLIMPETILSTLINIELAKIVTGDSVFSDYRRCFHMIVLYPSREKDHFNINLTFKGHVNRHGSLVVYTALAGYHLGCSEAFSNAGRPVEAVYLSDRCAVTTMFGEAIHSLTEPFRSGLMTTLRMGENTPT